MAVAVIAARLRSTLIDAAASYRQRDEFEVLNQLVRIVGVLDKFPLPSKSAEADMIATAVQQRATLEERQVCACPGSMPTHVSCWLSCTLDSWPQWSVVQVLGCGTNACIIWSGLCVAVSSLSARLRHHCTAASEQINKEHQLLPCMAICW